MSGMDGREYLNQIAAANRPVGKTSGNIMSSKFFKFGLIAVGALVLIIILGTILGGGKGGEKNQSIELYLHIKNTNEMVQKYQPNIKSSELRSNSASLSVILTDVYKKIESYLTEKYDFKEKDIKGKVADEAESKKEELDEELFEAKINGTLDRVFAYDIAYEISMLMSEETKLLKSAKDETLKEALTSNYNSLENLYSKFNDFSETK